jgi:hypothetical protein
MTTPKVFNLSSKDLKEQTPNPEVAAKAMKKIAAKLKRGGPA